MVTNPELDDLDLGSIIDAVRRASAKELAKLTEISSKLDGAPVRSSGTPVIKAELDTKKVENAVKNGVESASVTDGKKARNNHRNRRPVSNGNARSNEVSLQVSQLAQPVSHKAAPINRIVDNKAIEQPLIAPEKKGQAVSRAQSPAVDVSVENHIGSLDDMPDKVEQAVKDGLSGFDGYWKDAAGKVRRKDGKYASKQESKAYTAAEVAQQRQQEQAEKSNERQAGVFAQFASSLKEFASERIKANLETDNDATDAAGAAAGGSFFYSAKEMYNLSQETKEAFEDAKQSVAGTKSKLTGARDALASSKVGKLLGGKPKSGSTELATVSNDASQAESVQRASDTKKESSSTVDGTPTSGQLPASRFEITNNSTSSDRATHSQVANQVGTSSQIDKVKDAQYKSEHLEVLKEQSSTQKAMIDDILDKLDEVKSAVGSASGGGGGGLMDLAGDLFDRKGRKGKRGRAGRGGKAGKIKSIFSKAGGAGKGIASKGMSMAGGAFKGLSKLGGIAGKAVPFLAPALMAYDAFSGFTDAEKQKETFNLKDGQEATLGQKSSMALGSVLDLGGLVSGGAGLLGSALGAMGFDGAQEALSFDSGDMAKGIYSFFGGDSGETAEVTSPTEKPKPQTKEERQEQERKEREYATDAVEYREANTFDREMMEREADPQRLTTEKVKERADETGRSFGQTYKRMDRERDKRERERESVSKEMGIDISGNVEHPSIGTMYSPKKKGDSLKQVDAEISRRREVEAMAKEGEFSNARFIGSQPKGFMDSLNTSIALKQKEDPYNQAKIDADGFSLDAPAPTTKGIAESTIRSNERVSDIKAQQADKAFREGGQTKKVKLDDETIKKITSGGGGNTHTTATRFIERNSKTKEASSPAKPVGSIPNNFSDRSLQRQSADLE
ncbi:hypothetical protein [Vibrio campbellii]|uniref:hypothetical protein n=1 Tax=Vibrio campbellii TaxID=680 RepID=UPI00210A5310|nr:hypothetical protein [Vibrio campbellii]UTZ44603.1 hypothetical protein HB764_25425 [Vibrio campbellii]